MLKHEGRPSRELDFHQAVEITMKSFPKLRGDDM